MRVLLALIAFTFGFAHATTGFAPGESHSLLPRVKVGDKFDYDYRSESSLNGNTSVFSAHFGLTIASLEPKGSITFANRQTGGEFASGGATRKVPDSGSTTKFKLNGELLSADPPYASPAQARFGQLLQIVVPSEKASIGTTWTWKTPPSETNGQIGVEGKGRCVAFEERLGTKCAKLELTMKETSGDMPASCSTTVWVSINDGLPVETVIAMSDVPLGPGAIANVKAVNRRSKVPVPSGG